MGYFDSHANNTQEASTAHLIFIKTNHANNAQHENNFSDRHTATRKSACIESVNHRVSQLLSNRLYIASMNIERYFSKRVHYFQILMGDLVKKPCC